MHNISHMTRDTIAHRQTGYCNKKRQLYIERKRERERVSEVLALESTEKKGIVSVCCVYLEVAKHFLLWCSFKICIEKEEDHFLGKRFGSVELNTLNFSLILTEYRNRETFLSHFFPLNIFIYCFLMNCRVY